MKTLIGLKAIDAMMVFTVTLVQKWLSLDIGRQTNPDKPASDFTNLPEDQKIQ